MSDTHTIERDQDVAVQALKAEYGDFVLLNLRNRPVHAINVVRSAWGEEPVLGVAEVQSRAQHPAFAKHSVEAFVAYLAEHDAAFGGFVASAAPTPSRLDTEDFTAEQRATLARRDDRPEPEPEAPKPYDQDLEEDDGEDADPSDFIEESDPPLSPCAEHALAQSAPSADDRRNDGRPAVAADDGATGRRATLEREGIVVLRKVSKGKVKGGYSLKTPDLIEAILATDLTIEEIRQRIAEAS